MRNEKLKIQYMSPKDLIPYDSNPRKISKDAVKYVANSIKEFGFKNPIIVDADNVIIAGHTRLKAAEQLKLESVPVVVVSGLSESQVKALRLADNKTAEFSEWDEVLLLNEIEDVLNIDMSEFGFDGLEDKAGGGTETVEKESLTADGFKPDAPQYVPKGKCPDISKMMDDSRAKDLLEMVNDMDDISDDLRHFLECAAYRFCDFNFSQIAEYYCHQEKEVQEMMERLALVIVDYDDAMKYGFVELTEELQEIIDE